MDIHDQWSPCQHYVLVVSALGYWTLMVFWQIHWWLNWIDLQSKYTSIVVVPQRYADYHTVDTKAIETLLLNENRLFSIIVPFTVLPSLGFLLSCQTQFMEGKKLAVHTQLYYWRSKQCSCDWEVYIFGLRTDCRGYLGCISEISGTLQ
jgi:hypothetical protein